MTATIDWSITKLECYTQLSGERDVVFMAYWTCTGKEDTYKQDVYGSQLINYNPTDGFIPYESLTENQVITWVKEAMGESAVTELELNIQKAIDEQRNPSTITPSLPW